MTAGSDSWMGKRFAAAAVRGSALAFAAVVLWGFSPVGVRAMVGESHAALPALPFAALRYTLAAMAFLPFLPALQGWSRADLWRGIGLGLVGVTGYGLPSVLGQRSVSAGLTGLLNGAEPLMIVLLGAALGRAWPKRLAVPATVLGLAGIGLLARGAGPALGTPGGIALILFGAGLWSLYCVLVPGLIARRGALPVTALAMLAGAAPILALGSAGVPGLLARMDGTDWAVLLGLGFGATMLSMLCWNLGTAALGAERAGWFLYMIPLISVVGGATLLGEKVEPLELLGGGLILLSVFLSQL